MPPKSRKNAKSTKFEHNISQESTPAATPLPLAPAQLPGLSDLKQDVIIPDFGGKQVEDVVDVHGGTLADHFEAKPNLSEVSSTPWFANLAPTTDLVSFDFDEPPSAAMPLTPAFGSPPAIPVPAPRNQSPIPRSFQDLPPSQAEPQEHVPVTPAPAEAAEYLAPSSPLHQPVPASPTVISSLGASLRKHARSPSFPVSPSGAGAGAGAGPIGGHPSPGQAATAAAFASPSPPPPRARSPTYPSRPVSPPTSSSPGASPVVTTPTATTAAALNKRTYPAPAKLTKLEGTTALPVAAVVDLGTAGRGSVSSGADGRRKGEGVKKDVPRIRTGSSRVLWSRWDDVKSLSGSTVGKLLFIGHVDPAALSIWDTSKLDSLVEILRVAVGSLMGEGGEWVVTHAGVVPDVPQVGGRAGSERPVVGILIGPGGETATKPGRLVLYSPQSKKVVNKADLAVSGRVEKFEASSSFIAISTTSPPQIHVLSSSTLRILRTIDSSHISTYIPPAAQSGLPLRPSAGAAVLSKLAAYSQLASPVVSPVRGGGYPDRKFGHGYGRSLDGQEAARFQAHTDQQDEWGRDVENVSKLLPQKMSYYEQRRHVPVFSLSHRLLAFSSPLSGSSPASSSTEFSAPGSYAGGDGGRKSGGVGMGMGLGLGMGSGPAGLPGTQAELGSAALKVGGSVWGGMRTLGGLALSAAKSRVASASGERPGAGVGTGVGVGGGGGNENAGRVGRFFSRSAPEGNSVMDARGGEGEGSASPGGVSSSGVPSTPVRGGSDSRTQVTVVDLGIVANSESNPTWLPGKVTEFSLSRDKQAAAMRFSSDGCSLAIAPYDGHTIKVYQLRTTPPTLHPMPNETVTPPSSLHIYNLRRGRTSAVVDSLDWSEDGRWLAAMTRKRTGHIFAINPYGGKTDIRSHLEGKVRNTNEMPTIPTDLHPLVRIRAANVEHEQPLASFSFAFIKPTDYLQPSSLVSPPQSMTSDTGSSPAHSPHDRRRPNYADGLLFDHVSSVLSLRRVFLDLKPKDQGYSIAAPAPFGNTSISFPGIGTPTRISASPSFKSSSPLSGGIPSPSQHRLHTRSGNASQPADVPMEMVAGEHVVMTWNLRRPWDGSQVKKSLQLPHDISVIRRTRADWLAQAELSTHSRSKNVLPRSIYLAHQFLFHTLGEDYHALIRRYQLDVPGTHIDVRKQVQVSAYPAGKGESFVEGLSSPRDIRHRTVSSSFDEPLASALGADLEQPHSLTILPAYPNGPAPRGPPLRNSIPVRAVTGIKDNVTGRIRQELQRVRSPRLKPKGDDPISSVPLEFDEEDEDFIQPHPQGHMRSPSQVEYPAAGEDESLAEGELWGGWSSTDRLAITEAEKFDDIDVLGILDEEQPIRQVKRSLAS